MNIIGWILFGLVVGAIAKFLMPGNDPGGWIVTILLGIAGSFVGGFLATTLMGRQEQTAGWIGSIIGAMVLLFVYRLIVGRRRVVCRFQLNRLSWDRAATQQCAAALLLMRLLPRRPHRRSSRTCPQRSNQRCRPCRPTTAPTE
ncbi:MAG: GlsB/YeaQ/YmgE family stress response membrane protein [Thermoanaerobaculia bacterium]